MQAQVSIQMGRASVRRTVLGDDDRRGKSKLGPPPEPIEPAASAEPTDEAAARDGFEAAVAQNLPALRACAMRLCRSQFDSDELVQLTLMRAFRAWPQLRNRSQARAWLLSIANRAFLDEVRRVRRRAPHVELDDDKLLAAEPDIPRSWEAITIDDVRAAVEQLSDDVRETYRKFALEGWSQEELARALGIPKNTVASRMFRARKQLRDLLTAEPGRRKRDQGSR
jgi:RNA polymerase sigma-70 factor (ECF subfamily)